MTTEAEDRRVPSNGEVMKILKRIDSKVEGLVETIHGTPKKDIDGNVKRTGGVMAEVKRLRFDHDKSKIERLRPTDRAAIYIAAIAATAAVVNGVLMMVG